MACSVCTEAPAENIAAGECGKVRERFSLGMLLKFSRVYSISVHARTFHLLIFHRLKIFMNIN